MTTVSGGDWDRGWEWEWGFRSGMGNQYTAAQRSCSIFQNYVFIASINMNGKIMKKLAKYRIIF